MSEQQVLALQVFLWELIKNNPKELKTEHLPNKGIDNINGPGRVNEFQDSYWGSSYVPTILHLF